MNKFEIIEIMAREGKRLQNQVGNLEATIKAKDSIISHGKADNERLAGQLNEERIDLSEAFAEIARLKEESKTVNDNDREILELCRAAHPDRHALTLVGYINEAFLTLGATIAEREAEANSYKALYDELKAELEVMKRAVGLACEEKDKVGGGGCPDDIKSSRGCLSSNDYKCSQCWQDHCIEKAKQECENCKHHNTNSTTCHTCSNESNKFMGFRQWKSKMKRYRIKKGE